MKRIALIILVSIATFAFAKTPEESALTRLAAAFANATDQVMIDCSDLHVFTVCIEGSGNVDLDKRRLDRVLPDLMLTWTSPWVAANDSSIGRAFATTYGDVIVTSMEVSTYRTWIIFFFRFD